MEEKFTAVDTKLEYVETDLRDVETELEHVTRGKYLLITLFAMILDASPVPNSVRGRKC